jgi:hypothetical protein
VTQLSQGELMKPLIVRFLLLGMLLTASLGASAAACTGQPLCQETSSFVAALTDFRTSKDGGYRVLTATLSFQNKTAAPLILGYVRGSGVAIDELGNRYAANEVRGLGVVERGSVDPKFSLQPGERSDARVELRWYAGSAVVGVTFNLELAVREIESLPGQQYRLGKEHALQFMRLSDGVTATAVTAPAPATPSAPASAPGAAPAPVPVADPCGDAPRCASNGPVALKIVRLLATKDGGYHQVRVTYRARNLSNERQYLAYQASSGVLLDNYGNRYEVRNTATGVQGIGQVTASKADPQFALQPGEARTFTLEYSRYVGSQGVIGTVYAPDLALAQLEILPSQQIRTARELTFGFTNQTAGTFAAGAVGNETLDAVQSINEAGKQLAEGLKSIFKKKD